MSWTMWHITGTGFDCEKSDLGKYRDFILNHEHSLRQANWKPCYNVTLDEFLWIFEEGCLESDYIEAPDSDDIRAVIDSGRIAEPVAVIMDQETGVVFDFPGLTDDGEDYVLFCARDPWEFNDKEKTLTLESLKEIMAPYAEELGVEMEEDVDLVYAG